MGYHNTKTQGNQRIFIYFLKYLEMMSVCCSQLSGTLVKFGGFDLATFHSLLNRKCISL
jgi:hypothetical protein